MGSVSKTQKATSEGKLTDLMTRIPLCTLFRWRVKSSNLILKHRRVEQIWAVGSFVAVESPV